MSTRPLLVAAGRSLLEDALEEARALALMLDDDFNAPEPLEGRRLLGIAVAAEERIECLRALVGAAKIALRRSEPNGVVR